MAELDQTHESYELGMHTEQLRGRTQQVFFSAEASDNLVYPMAPAQMNAKHDRNPWCAPDSISFLM